MNQYDLRFLNEFGLNDIQIKIYNYLLNNRFGSIDDIKNELNFSYTQVRDNLRYLEDHKFITSNDSKPKVYFRVDPKVILNNLLKEKNDQILEKINKLEEILQVDESSKGVCTRNITFYHYSEISTGIEYIYNLIEKAESEILLSSLPPSLLKSFERALHKAYMNGVKLKIFYSESDFESIRNYFDIITDILKDIKITIVETNERTCRYVRFNDLIVSEGVILIDSYFNSALFIDDKFFHFNGFYMPNMADGVRNMLNAKRIIKSIEITPEIVQNILNVIQDHDTLKTRDLSIRSKIGGAKLREILNLLINQGLIKEEIIKNDKAGRPKRVYSVVN
ncbi:MAG: TrmB family transcriptional regulator [Promethearchaeota archaeon]